MTDRSLWRPPPDMPRTLHVVLHDVAPPTLAGCRRVIDALAPIGSFALTLLAVPSFHGAPRDRAFEHWLVGRAAAGDEVALHGYTHADAGRARGPVDWLLRRGYTQSEGEFFDLDADTARRRIDAGLAWLRELALTPAGFIAPAWLMGPGAWQALHGYPFSYTCTFGRIHLLRQRRSIVNHSQVFSTAAASRRAFSTLRNHALAHVQRGDPIVRLELHPRDADFESLRRCWQALAWMQSRDREVTTLQTLVRRIAGGPGAGEGNRTLCEGDQVAAPLNRLGPASVSARPSAETLASR